MQLAKIKTIASGIVFFIATLGFMALIISFGLTNSLYAQKWYFYLGVGLLLSALFHGGVFIIQKSWQAKKEKITNPVKDNWAVAGQALLLWDVIKIVFIGIVVLVISIVMFSIAFSNLAQKQITLNNNLYFIISGIPIYWIVSAILKFAMKGWNRVMPEYELFKDGIRINPKIIGIKTSVLQFTSMKSMKHAS